MPWVVEGGSQDGSYRERGLGVIVDLETALAIGRLFEQEAIFWVERDQLSVVSCDSPERKEMGSWTERLRGPLRKECVPAATD